MESTLENPVLNDDAMGTQLREAAAAADRGEGIEPSSAQETGDRAPVPDQPKEVPSETKEVTSPEIKPDERPRDEQGRFKQQEEKPPEQPEPEVKESAYVRAQKEQERLNRNRQEFEQEKVQRRQQWEQIDQALRRDREQFERERNGYSQNGNGERPQYYPAKDYAGLAEEAQSKAEKLADQGDIEAAIEQVKLAGQARRAYDKVSQMEVRRQQEQAVREYQDEWGNDMHERCRIEPDAGTPGTERSQEISSLIEKEFPGIFERIPVVQLPNGQKMGGFSFANEIAKLRVEARTKAGLVSGLEAENKRLKAENAQHRMARGIEGSSPTEVSSPKSFDAMTLREQAAHLRRSAELVEMG